MAARSLRRRLFGALAFLVIGLPMLLALALAGAFVWANGQGGRAALMRLAAQAVPGLSLEGLEGPLPERLALSRLSLADAQGPWLELEGAEIALDWSALLDGRLRIERIEARRLALHRAPAPAAPAEPDAPAQGGFALPRLPLAIDLARLALARIELGAPLLGAPAAFALAGDARLDARGLAAGLEARRLDGPGEARLALDLAPGADRLSARLALEEPAGGVLGGLAGQAGAPVSLALTLDGPANGAALTLAARIGAAGIEAEGLAALSPQGAGRLSLEGRARPGPYLPEALRPAVGEPAFRLLAERGASGALALPQLALSLPLGEVVAEGGLSAEGRAALRLIAELGPAAPLAPLLPPGLGWQGLRLNATAEGPLDALLIDALAEPRGLALPEAYGPPALALLGEAPRLAARLRLPGRIEALRLSGAQALLSAEGDLLPALDARLALDLPDLAPLAEALGAPARGALSARARLTGALAAPEIALELTSPGLEALGRKLGETRLSAALAGLPETPSGRIDLASSLDGLPLALAAEGGWDGAQARLGRLAARFGAASAEGEGHYTPGEALPLGRLSLAVPDLAPFAALTGQAMAGRLSLEALSAPDKVSLRLDAPQLALAGQSLSARAEAGGRPEDLRLVLDGQARLPDGRQARLSTRARLLAEAERRVLELAALDLSAPPFGLRLSAPGRVLIGHDGAVETPGLAFAARPGGTLRLAGRYAATGPIAGRASLSGLDLAALRAALPLPEGTPAFAGQAGLEATLSGTAEAPVAQVTLDGRNLTADLPALAGLPAGTLAAEARYAAQALTASAQFRLAEMLRLDGRLALPRGLGPEAPMQARLTGEADAGALSRPALAGTADQVAGRLSLDLNGSGTLSAPVLGGQARFSGGSWRNPLYGIRYTGIESLVRAEGNRLVIERFRLTTPGRGSIEAAGTIDAAGEGLPGEIRLTARGAQPIAGDLGRVTLDADLDISGPLAGGAQVGGLVRLRRADLRLPETVSNAVPTLDPVRRRGAPPAPPARAPVPAPPYLLALKVEAPQAIFLRWRGLDAEMGGELAIGGTARQPDITGQLRLRRGQFDLLDRRLTFSRGTVTFSGPVIPELDFLTTSTVQGTTLNIGVTGQATEPKLAFTSSPQLPQDEVLARLLFQRSASQLSPLELAQLAAGLAGLTGALPGSEDGGPLARLGRRLGLDRLGLGSSTTEESGTTTTNSSTANNLPSLEAGTYVGQGVYVGVQQGAEAGSTRVGVEIELTPRLRLESSSGGDAGERVGLKWELEY